LLTQGRECIECAPLLQGRSDIQAMLKIFNN
jgi:hypothetical protein